MPRVFYFMAFLNWQTLLAKALATEAEVPFMQCLVQIFIQVYAGLGASRIRKLSKKQKKQVKVIFIDEIDALGKARKGTNSNSGSEEGIDFKCFINRNVRI